MRCAICGSYATANLFPSTGPEGMRCESCLHETLALHRFISGLLSSSAPRRAAEAREYIEGCLGSELLAPEKASLLLRLRMALEGV